LSKLLKINIFYDSNYWLKDRKIFDKNIFNSSLFNFYYKKKLKSLKPISNKFIKSGPQKLINNLIKYFKDSEDIVFNKNKFSNYYFPTVDLNSLENIKNILKGKDKKIIAGPLYTNSTFKNLIKLCEDFTNLKIVTASESSKNMAMKIAGESVSSDTFVVLPIAVISSNEKLTTQRKEDKCLIYFKGGDKKELDQVKKILKNLNIQFKLFEYGNYSNLNLIRKAKNYKFGVVLGRTESQGIAINEIMGCGLPLLIFNSTINEYEGMTFEGTSVPFWNNECGEIVDRSQSMEETIENFISNVKSGLYNPQNYVRKNLSVEAMRINFLNIFESF